MTEMPVYYSICRRAYDVTVPANDTGEVASAHSKVCLSAGIIAATHQLHLALARNLNHALQDQQPRKP